MCVIYSECDTYISTSDNMQRQADHCKLEVDFTRTKNVVDCDDNTNERHTHKIYNILHVIRILV